MDDYIEFVMQRWLQGLILVSFAPTIYYISNNGCAFYGSNNKECYFGIITYIYFINNEINITFVYKYI